MFSKDYSKKRRGKPSKYDRIVDEIYLKLLEHGTYRGCWLVNDYPEFEEKIYYIVQRLKARYKDVGVVRINVVSTRNVNVIDPRFRNESIIYLSGREWAVAYHILLMLRNLLVRPRSLRAVLERNNVPRAAIKEIKEAMSIIRKAIKQGAQPSGVG